MLCPRPRPHARRARRASPPYGVRSAASRRVLGDALLNTSHAEPKSVCERVACSCMRPLGIAAWKWSESPLLPRRPRVLVTLHPPPICAVGHRSCIGSSFGFAGTAEEIVFDNSVPMNRDSGRVRERMVQKEGHVICRSSEIYESRSPCTCMRICTPHVRVCLYMSMSMPNVYMRVRTRAHMYACAAAVLEAACVLLLSAGVAHVV